MKRFYLFSVVIFLTAGLQVVNAQSSQRKVTKLGLYLIDPAKGQLPSNIQLKSTIPALTLESERAILPVLSLGTEFGITRWDLGVSGLSSSRSSEDFKMFKKILSTIVVFLLLTSSLFAAELKIFTNEEPPLNFRGQDNQVTGFAVDIVQEILKRTATNSKINLLTWARGYQYLQQEENVFLFSMAQTDQRKNKFQWVGPLATKRAILIAKKDSGIFVHSEIINISESGLK